MATFDENLWGKVQEAFEFGWLSIRDGHDKEWHVNWREQFYELTGTTAAIFNWSAYREYLAERGSPSVH